MTASHRDEHLDLKGSRITMHKFLLGAGVIGALVAAGSVIPMAHAESGRRLCVYSDENAGGRHVWKVVNYKKDGTPECPRLYAPDVQSMGGDWKKITCESLASLLGKPSDPAANLQPDPCPALTEDHVYDIVQDQGTHTYTVADKGSYRQYQRSIRFHVYPRVAEVSRFCATTSDAQGKQLDSDCDRVGVNGTSRLFYRPGTTTVHFTVEYPSGTVLSEKTVVVAHGDQDARNYCVDRRVKGFDEYNEDHFC